MGEWQTSSSDAAGIEGSRADAAAIGGRRDDGHRCHENEVQSCETRKGNHGKELTEFGKLLLYL